MELSRRDIRTDVRHLDGLLGEVLRAQTAESTFDAVEELRTQAIENRDRGDRDHDDLRALCADLDDEEGLAVARAFTTYFELVNLAEERDRIRALREQSQASRPDDGLEAAVEDLADADPETVQRAFEDVLVEPTFTAHPTEARRKTVKSQLRSVADELETLDQQLLTGKEQRQHEEELAATVTSLWQTRQVRQRRPEPFDEALNVQWHLEHVLFDVVGEVYREFEHALDDGLDASLDVPKLLEFRSWAGSDRDGNPYVTREVTERTLDRQRRVVLEKYLEALDDLVDVVSHDGSRLSHTDRFAAQLDENRDRFPAAADRVADEYDGEPYRQHVALLTERLDRVTDPRDGGYATPDEFRAELAGLAADLRANGASEVARLHVDPLVRQVETFGFTLASLDLRDHREEHTHAISAVLDRHGTDYAGMSESERVAFLTDAITQPSPMLDLTDTDALDDEAARVLERFDALADWHREFGADAIDTYCISMCEQPSHVLEVLFLADQAGVVDLPDTCDIDVVPLLETEAALSDARRIMGTLFENEAYAAALAARGDTQEVMLGYSDSNKENGYLAARWSLYRNQKRLAAICEDYGVDLRLFHGRGGSVSRGGGRMNDALLALPNESVTGQVKFTEQGETIAEKYANPTIAERELEQILNAQVRARVNAIETPTEPVDDEWLAAMATAADAARDAYRDLLDREGFVSYFEHATPITVIEALNLGSRPASRSEDRSIEDLRAIPWVFSWTQSRCIVPGWYSLATGLDAYLDDGGDVETLQEMYESWPFFRTVLGNAAHALARTDMAVARGYADLAPDPLRERFFPDIEAEYERAVDLVTTIAQTDTLPIPGWLSESLDRRNPYVDPLHHLQMELLATDDRSAVEERTLRLAVKGIAAGMQNTG